MRDLIKHFYSICSVLPCEICSTHAISVLKKCNINNIDSKEKLKDFCWKLHNIVNKKLNKSEFSKEERDKLYEKINMNIVISNYNYIMLKDYRIHNQMMNAFARKNITINFIKYLKKNIDKFNI